MREQIAELNGLLEVEEDRLSRLVITRETVDEVVSEAAAPMRAGQIATAMGLEDSAAKREGLRSKLKRLVERGWAIENGPGLFSLAGVVARELAGRAEREDGIASSPAR